MAKENIDRGTKGILSKEKRYSIFSLARNTLNYHQNWKRAWRVSYFKRKL